MSARPQPLTPAMQEMVGSTVAAWRDEGLCWKTIAQRLDMSRVQAWRCLRLYRMKQKTFGMKHQGGCEGDRAA